MNGTDHNHCFYTEFTLVETRRKRKNKVQKERPSSLVLLQYVREELRQDDWSRECQRIIEESLTIASLVSPDVLCLGLGSPSTSTNARVQLGFLLDICDHLKVDRTNVSVYDPIFTTEDASLFRELQIQLLTENKIGGYSLMRPTICFMPHCDLVIYENLLKANWSKEKLPNMLLVANRLADYLDSNPAHKLEARAPYLLRLAPMLNHYPLPLSNSWPTAFNNTAVQFIGVHDSAISTLVVADVIDGDKSFE